MSLKTFYITQALCVVVLSQKHCFGAKTAFVGGRPIFSTDLLNRACSRDIIFRLPQDNKQQLQYSSATLLTISSISSRILSSSLQLHRVCFILQVFYFSLLCYVYTWCRYWSFFCQFFCSASCTCFFRPPPLSHSFPQPGCYPFKSL